MHSALSQSLAGAGAVEAAAAGAAGGAGVEGAGPRRWVSKWVDYTQKYGVGYLLCDGSVGVYFNDATKIVLSSDNRHFEYVERRPSRDARGSARRQSVEPARQRFTLASYPREDRGLEKKVKLLTHFRDYLRAKFAESSTRNQPEERAARAAGSATRDMVYVKKWLRAKHAILFRLSDKTVQVNFFDNSEILLASEARVVTYVDKHGTRTTQSLARVTAGDRKDIQKRLRYTKDILAQMVAGSGQQRSDGGSAPAR